MDKWIFSLKLRNSAGVLAALTALFADRGVSIESLSAQGGGGVWNGAGDGGFDICGVGSAEKPFGEAFRAAGVGAGSDAVPVR